MKNNNGFALMLSLMLLFVLTLIALILLLISGSYYSSARNLFENENARITCEQVSRLMVDTHNLETSEPRFFLDPERWPGLTMIPYEWNGYTVKAQRKTSWNSSGINEIHVEVSKGRYLSSRIMNVSQIRFEDFSLYLNSWQSLSTESLVNSRVFASNGIELQNPVVRFRDFVQAAVTPETNASFRKQTEQVIAYPPLNSVLSSTQFFNAAQANGLVISAQNPLFWNGTLYEINLDLFSIQEQTGNRWKVTYNGTDLGIVNGLHFWFDDSIKIRQTYEQIPNLPESKLISPIYFSSSSNVLIDSSLQSMVGPNHYHPICITAGGSISIAESAPSLVRIQALMIAFGTSIHDGMEYGLILTPGADAVPLSQTASWEAEISESSFIVESEKREVFLAALGSGKCVWLRGTIALMGPILISPDLEQLHFQSSDDQYPFFPSLAFVKILEGSQQWH